jgi:hypothetical protein
MKQYRIYIIVAALFTLFLGYIDEGYYNFNFLSSIGNIFVLSLYMLLFILTQVGFDFLFNKVLYGTTENIRQIASIGFGLFVPIFFIVILPMIIRS